MFEQILKISSLDAGNNTFPPLIYAVIEVAAEKDCFMIENASSIPSVDKGQRRLGCGKDWLVLENSSKIGVSSHSLALSGSEMHIDETDRGIIDSATSDNSALKCTV